MCAHSLVLRGWVSMLACLRSCYVRVLQLLRCYWYCRQLQPARSDIRSLIAWLFFYFFYFFYAYTEVLPNVALAQ
jgi:hypothetical protein